MSPSAPTPLRVAYLINQYPKVSHSFIRREILALERQGVFVLRTAIRGWADAVVDPLDQAERVRTRYLLQGGVLRLLRAVLRVGIHSPLQFLSAAGLAFSMYRRAGHGFFKHMAYLAEACELVGWLAAERVTHLHAHFGTNPAEVAMLTRELGGPAYSFTVHGPEEFDKPEALGLAEKGRRAAFVVAISSFGRSQLYRWLSADHWHKVRVVHCGLERAFHEGTLTPPSGTSRRLVCVGRLCEQKGQLLLIRAVRAVLARGTVVELVLAGDGEMRPALEALIDRFGLQAQVRITGWIDSEQVRAEILAARALVLPSFAEGLPVVIMEAMSLGRPVITTFVAGIPELVDSECGWLVPAGAEEQLAAAIEACLNATPDQLARMGDGGRQRVLGRHDVDQEAAKLVALFSGQSGDLTRDALSLGTVPVSP